MKKSIVLFMSICIVCSVVTMSGCTVIKSLLNKEPATTPDKGDEGDADGKDSEPSDTTGDTTSSSSQEITWEKAKEMLTDYEEMVDDKIANNILISGRVRCEDPPTYEQYAMLGDVQVIDILENMFGYLYYGVGFYQGDKYKIWSVVSMSIFDETTIYCGGTGDSWQESVLAENINIKASSYNYQNCSYYISKENMKQVLKGYSTMNPKASIETGAGVDGYKSVEKIECIYDASNEKLKITVVYNTSVEIAEIDGKLYIVGRDGDSGVLTDCLTTEIYEYENGLFTKYQRSLKRVSDGKEVVPGSGRDARNFTICEIDYTVEKMFEGLPFEVIIEKTSEPLSSDSYY